MRKFGKPDFFITLTCNTQWREIQDELFPGQNAKDRPELIARVFNQKVQHLKHIILDKHVLGHSVAHMEVNISSFQREKKKHFVLKLEGVGGKKKYTSRFIFYEQKETKLNPKIRRKRH